MLDWSLYYSFYLNFSGDSFFYNLFYHHWSFYFDCNLLINWNFDWNLYFFSYDLFNVNFLLYLPRYIILDNSSMRNLDDFGLRNPNLFLDNNIPVYCLFYYFILVYIINNSVQNYSPFIPIYIYIFFVNVNHMLLNPVTLSNCLIRSLNQSLDRLIHIDPILHWNLNNLLDLNLNDLLHWHFYNLLNRSLNNNLVNPLLFKIPLNRNINININRNIDIFVDWLWNLFNDLDYLLLFDLLELLLSRPLRHSWSLTSILPLIQLILRNHSILSFVSTLLNCSLGELVKPHDSSLAHFLANQPSLANFLLD
jgi:hypothetical protein